jgi:uncharacterized LabA/DUF88 family protein
MERSLLMRCGVFVDAGYLYAAGASAIAGTRGTSRTSLNLDHNALIAKLVELAKEQAPGTSLLRIYWYDGILQGRRSQTQQDLAVTDNVKVRLGTMSGGRQKGVDSLVVTDLIELARNGAITDAVLLSGDEDLRVGVQIAQSFGVRVHLVGIEPSRGNQSNLLREESDTTREFLKADVEQFLSVRARPEGDSYERDQEIEQVLSSESTGVDTEQCLQEVASDVALALQADDLSYVVNELSSGSRWIPSEYDSRLLGMSRGALGRDLTQSERDSVRAAFREAVQNRVGTE